MVAEDFSAIVSKDLFGGNFLFDRDRLGASGTFDDVAARANVENVRFPGGTITEKYFDLRDPDRATVIDVETGRTVELLRLSEFLERVGSSNMGASIVIPTNSLLVGEIGDRHPRSNAYEIVREFVSDLLAGRYGDTPIKCLEIGNEYWLGGKQNHVEYTRIADIVARASQDAIDAHKAGGVEAGWTEPSISIQIGQYGQHSTSPGWQQDAYIRGGLSNEAAEAIDGVIAHYYTRGSFADLKSHEYFFDRLDGWGNDSRFRGIDYHITEWNIEYERSLETGLGQAAVMTWMVSEMVAQGVDSAYVWPLQQNTSNDLSGNEGTTALTLAGEAFRLMASLLPGSKLMSRAETGAGISYVYKAKGEYVVAASALGAGEYALSLNLAQFGYDTVRVNVHLLDATDDRLGPGAIPMVTQQTLEVQDVFNFRLSDHQTAFFEIEGTLIKKLAASEVLPTTSVNSVKVALKGGASDDILTGTSKADKIIGGSGDDAISGRFGNDRLFGGEGHDKLYGGAGFDEMQGGSGNDISVGLGGFDKLYGEGGADRLKGNVGNDKLYGGAGNDKLEGGFGSDLLKGGAGTDYLQGDNGQDALFGGKGSDTLYANKGDDRLDGGAGDDKMIGGWGADTFVFSLGSGRDRVADLTRDDRLEIDGRLFDQASPRAAHLVDYAKQTNAGLVFDFGDGDVLTLSNVTNLGFVSGATDII
ncbi:MAG: calcium-binding protein [Limimaricola soesokkakensis]|uniref:calcium-binding protein n=1 Tax=Limimaricola soesokkakensis TaxID=1343159 RepID=UPI004059F391